MHAVQGQGIPKTGCELTKTDQGLPGAPIHSPHTLLPFGRSLASAHHTGRVELNCHGWAIQELHHRSANLHGHVTTKPVKGEGQAGLDQVRACDSKRASEPAGPHEQQMQSSRRCSPGQPRKKSESLRRHAMTDSVLACSTCITPRVAGHPPFCLVILAEPTPQVTLATRLVRSGDRRHLRTDDHMRGQGTGGAWA